MLTDIIKIFKERSDYVSGEEMSGRLGITRAAIWKKIKELRSKGYKIQASTAKGYKLIKPPDFSVEELRTLVSGNLGREVVFFEEVDSTNTAGMKLAEQGASHGTVVIADRQTKGKGRLGRIWVSPPKGNIYMSIIIRPDIEPRDATLLTVIAAVACARAIMGQSGLRVKIKWPNDLMLGGRKLGGILTEVKSDPDRIIFAVIGIGINVNIKNKNFPPDIQPVATSMREELGRIQSRTLIIACILKEMEHWYEVLIKDGCKPLLEEWRLFLSTLGRKVKVGAGDKVLTGIAEDVDNEGRLVLRLPSGILKKVSAGDVTILK